MEEGRPYSTFAHSPTGREVYTVAVFLIVLSLPGIIAGIGLLQRRSWGRILAIIVAIFNLLNVPIGTVAGIYALWILMDERAHEFF